MLFPSWSDSEDYLKVRKQSRFGGADSVGEDEDRAGRDRIASSDSDSSNSSTRSRLPQMWSMPSVPSMDQESDTEPNVLPLVVKGGNDSGNGLDGEEGQFEY